MLRPEEVILASSSPRRRTLLESLIGEDFRVNAPGIEELWQGTLPESILINAERKAASVAKWDQDALVIGADTGVIIDGIWLGKPDDEADARAMLRLLSGKTHEVLTGVSIMMRCRDIQMLFADRSYVTFKTLSDNEIEHYIRVADTLDMAGGYGIQDHPECVIEKYEGSYTNIMGLPMEKMKAALTLHDVAFLSDLLDSEEG